MSVLLAAPGPISEYCRLCASRVSADRLLSFSSNDTESNSLLNAIRRLKPTITRGDGLPQSICSLCDTLLRSTTSFLKKVDCAQELLSKKFLATECESVKLENANEGSDAINTEYLNADVKYHETPIMIKDPFNEMKEEFVVNIISGRPSDESASKVRKRRIKSADSMSSKESSIIHDSSDGISTNSFEPLPKLKKLQNEDTDEAISMDGNDTKPIDESQSSALNLTQSEGILKVETLEVSLSNSKAVNEIIQPAVANAEPIAHTARACRSSNRNHTKALSSSNRKLKCLSKNNKGKVKLPASNSSTLPLYNGLPTAIDDLPIQFEDPTVECWSDYYYCKRCNTKCDTLQNLRQHWWTTHKRCVSFKCTMCTIRRLTYKIFFRHVIRHQKSLEKCCEFCNKRFVSAADARYHKKLDHPEENRPHQCGSCGTGFNSALHLQEHQDDYIVQKASKPGERRFECKECGEKFINKITLVTHEDTHDPTKNVCKFCNKSCTSKHTLKEHIFIVHDSTLKFYCQICGKGFKLKSKLREHLDIHEGIKRFSCSFCNKKFRIKSQLKSHQLTHTSVRLNVCEICDKSYKFKNGLKSHIRTHEEGFVPYACDVCTKTFQNWSNYSKHMKRMHDRNISKKNNTLQLSAQF